MRKFYDNETAAIITIKDLKEVWDNMEPWERDEYDGNFGHYIAACMWWNNGTLEEIS